jgi:dipeptidyl aminopeptidase/acylaminoacyl peptidase
MVLPTLTRSNVYRYRAASFHHPVSSLKVTQEDHRIIFLVEGEEDDDEASARISGQANVLAYDSLFVRHLDTYVSKKRAVIYSGTLLLYDGKYNQLKGSYDGMMVKGPINTSKYRLSPQAHGQVDLQPGGNLAALVLREASLNPANSTSSFINLMPISGSKESMAQLEKMNRKLSRKDVGAASSPKFSPEGRRLAFLQQDNEINESGRNRLFLYDLDRNKEPMELARLWDRSPHEVSWSSDGKHLWLIAQDRGYSSAFWLPVDAIPETLPTKLLTDESIMSLVPLQNSQVLASMSSFTNPGGFQILDILEDGKIPLVDTLSKSLAPTIQSMHIEEFNFPSDRSTKVRPTALTQVQIDSSRFMVFSLDSRNSKPVLNIHLFSSSMADHKIHG